MVTTAYVAGLLTAACLVALVRLTSGEASPALPAEVELESEEEDACPWRKSWELRTRACLNELRTAPDCAARIEALRWARRLHFERRSHAYQDEGALADAEAFWEEVEALLRPSGPG